MCCLCQIHYTLAPLVYSVPRQSSEIDDAVGFDDAQSMNKDKREFTDQVKLEHSSSMSPRTYCLNSVSCLIRSIQSNQRSLIQSNPIQSNSIQLNSNQLDLIQSIHSPTHPIQSNSTHSIQFNPIHSIQIKIQFNHSSSESNQSTQSESIQFNLIQSNPIHHLSAQVISSLFYLI